MNIELKNAIIKAKRLTVEDHGVLSCWITLDYGGCCQGFGGWVIGGLPGGRAGEHSRQKNLAAEFIVRVLRAAGVDEWDQIVGKTIRVKASHDKVHAIGHIVKDDRWFNPKEVFESWEVSK